MVVCLFKSDCLVVALLLVSLLVRLSCVFDSVWVCVVGVWLLGCGFVACYGWCLFLVCAGCLRL